MKLIINIIFAIIISLVSTITFMFLPKLLGLAENQGLVGGAIVFWYGVFGLLVGIIISFFLFRKRR